MKALTLDEFDYDSIRKDAPARLDVHRKTLTIQIPATTLTVDVASLLTEPIKEWPDGASAFRLDESCYVTTADAIMMRDLLREKDHRSCIRAWDYEDHVWVASDAWHNDLKPTDEETTRVEEATAAIANLLRKLTGKAHLVTYRGDKGYDISLDDMFTDEKEPERWLGWARGSRELDDLCKKYNLIWES